MSMECSSTTALLLLEGAVYVSRHLFNKVREPESGLGDCPNPKCMFVFSIPVPLPSFVRVPNQFCAASPS